MEAIAVLKLAPENPIIDFWLAYLDKDNKDTYFEKALNGPVDFVFPHRTGTAKILKTFLQETPDWKMHYYLGLIWWSKGLIPEAKEQFMACGSHPDHARNRGWPLRDR